MAASWIRGTSRNALQPSVSGSHNTDWIPYQLNFKGDYRFGTTSANELATGFFDMYRTTLQQKLEQGYSAADLYASLSNTYGMDEGTFSNWLTYVTSDIDYSNLSLEEYRVAQELVRSMSSGQPFGGALGPVGEFMEDVGQSVTDVLEPVAETVTDVVGENILGEDGVGAVVDVGQEVVSDTVDFLEDPFDFLDIPEMPDIPGIDALEGTNGAFAGGGGTFLLGGLTVPRRNNRQSGYLAARSGASNALPAQIRRPTLLGGA